MNLRWPILIALFVVFGSQLRYLMGQSASRLKEAIAVNEAVGSLAGREAIVFGGTAGIGQGIAERLASAGANVAIVGRNKEAGQAIVKAMSEVNPAGRYRFVAADLVVLANCKTAISSLLGDLDRLDYVVQCQSKATTQGLTKTAEGIDEKLSLHYYSRVYVSQLLTPLMERTAAQHGADVRVLSVLSGGVHAAYAHTEDDPFLEENYSMKNAADAAGFYTDLWIDKMAQLHKNVTWVHAAPGIVASSWGTDLPTPMRVAVRALQATPMAKSTAECAELMLQGLVSPALKGGAQVIDQYGKPATFTTAHTPELVDLMHERTRAVLAPFL